MTDQKLTIYCAGEKHGELKPLVAPLLACTLDPEVRGADVSVKAWDLDRADRVVLCGDGLVLQTFRAVLEGLGYTVTRADALVAALLAAPPKETS